jgi:hypothetical protein
MKRFIPKFILIVLLFASCMETPSNSDTNNSVPDTTEQEKSITDQTTVTKDYSGNYNDLDASTGWETTVNISGQSFSAITTNTITGEIIANASGKLEGTNLIDEYGQTIGNVFEHSLALNFGNGSINCLKK